MEDIYVYIQKPKEDRQKHLKLDQPCIHRGAGSYYLKGLLAHILDTTIPTGKKIYLCHACHNGKCSNPNHLYWGTPKENKADCLANGGKDIWQYTVDKYGLSKAQELCRHRGNTHGTGNKGKVKTREHKENISKSIKENYANKTDSVEPHPNKGKSLDTVQCPHCGKEGGYNPMRRWHFDNCRHKE